MTLGRLGTDTARGGHAAGRGQRGVAIEAGRAGAHGGDPSHTVARHTDPERHEGEVVMIRRIATLALVAIASLAAGTAAAANPVVEIDTTQGAIRIELYPDAAPKTVANFLQYVKDGFYKGTIFHRVMDGFMVQGGGLTPDMKEKDTHPPVENEANNGLKNNKYTIAMAPRMDPNSASAQFYVNVVDNNMLNYPGQDGFGYTVFGKVVDGTDTIDKIKAVETTTKGSYQNVPVKPIVIESATVVSK